MVVLVFVWRLVLSTIGWGIQGLPTTPVVPVVPVVLLVLLVSLALENSVTFHNWTMVQLVLPL